ncbi:MAG: hypothetical protein CMJ83_18585 [Planctomycetes bacterium]|nr:hypothetical protein [Planctomycetota bacterium]
MTGPVLAHGPSVFVPAGGGVPSTSPTPAPAPAPAPLPRPGAGPGGGQTPPGAPQPGTTPAGKGHGTGGAGAPGGGRGHGARGGTSRYAGRKAKFSAANRYLLGAVKLPWEPSFLPRDDRNGYDGREHSFDEAVRGFGGDKSWSLQSKPTLVFVYNAGNKNDMTIVGKLDETPGFVAASYFFNLIRVDVRTITNADLKKKYKKGASILVYKANGERVTTLRGNLNPNGVVRSLKPVIEADYGRPGSGAIAQMESVLARKAMLKKQLKMQEAKLIDPATGQINKTVSDRVTRIRRELRRVKNEEEGLVVRD